MPLVPNVKFSNGLYIPCVGLGTFKVRDDKILIKAVKEAIEAGYRHFDCAYMYFNEQHVGRAIRESIRDSNGQLKREDLFIVNYFYYSSYHF
jgi:aldehyde reductase